MTENSAVGGHLEPIKNSAIWKSVLFKAVLCEAQVYKTLKLYSLFWIGKQTMNCHSLLCQKHHTSILAKVWIAIQSNFLTQPANIRVILAIQSKKRFQATLYNLTLVMCILWPLNEIKQRFQERLSVLCHVVKH